MARLERLLEDDGNRCMHVYFVVILVVEFDDWLVPAGFRQWIGSFVFAYKKGTIVFNITRVYILFIEFKRK